MGWIPFIPLVALAVWILSNLVKNQQDEARRREMRPRPPELDTNQRREPPKEARPRRVERPRPPLRPQPVAVQDRPRPRPALEAEPVRLPRRPSSVEQPVVVAQLVLPPVPAFDVSVTPTVTANRKPTKAIQNMYALLQNRNTVATAFVLMEVLGKPRCKRH